MKPSFARVVLSLLVGVSALATVSPASAVWSQWYNRGSFATNINSDWGVPRQGRIYVGWFGSYNTYKNTEAVNRNQVVQLQMLCEDYSNDPGRLTILDGQRSINTKNCTPGKIPLQGRVYIQQ